MLDEPLSMARPIEKEAEAVTRAGEWGFGVTGLCKITVGIILLSNRAKPGNAGGPYL